jgi:hypothetical protein
VQAPEAWIGELAGESELRSLVSSMCDGIFVIAIACAEFVLGENVQRAQYTDSSFARHLASRHGCGPVHHFSGSIDWVQHRNEQWFGDLQTSTNNVEPGQLMNLLLMPFKAAVVSARA